MKYIKLFENFDYTQIPSDIKKTLDEYTDFFIDKFDWNSKMDEYGNSFNKWYDNYRDEQLLKNKNKLLLALSSDLVLLKKRKLADKKLEAFEELIIPVLGDKVLLPALSKFEEDILLDPNLTISELEKEMEKAKGIFGEEGNIDQRKIQQSEIFKGDNISLPAFERFVSKNPEYKGVFDTWKKLFDTSIELTLKDLNAFRSSTSFDSILNLYKYIKELN